MLLLTTPIYMNLSSSIGILCGALTAAILAGYTDGKLLARDTFISTTTWLMIKINNREIV